jgi:hypothetical protein
MIEATQTDSGAIAASTNSSPASSRNPTIIAQVADPSGRSTNGAPGTTPWAPLPGGATASPLDVIERKVPDTEARGLPVQGLNYACAVTRELDDPQWKG